MLFRREFAAGHGLTGCVRESVVEKMASQMASHTFCCFVKIGRRDLTAAIRGAEGLVERIWGIEASEELEGWVYGSERAECFLQTAEFLWPWLATETDLALVDFKRLGLVAIPTVAEEQLILQWWSEKFLQGLEWLLTQEFTISEEDKEGVKGVFETGEAMMRAAGRLMRR